MKFKYFMLPVSMTAILALGYHVPMADPGAASIGKGGWMDANGDRADGSAQIYGHGGNGNGK
jgi:hypothetical protein